MVTRPTNVGGGEPPERAASTPPKLSSPRVRIHQPWLIVHDEGAQTFLQVEAFKRQCEIASLEVEACPVRNFPLARMFEFANLVVVLPGDVPDDANLDFLTPYEEIIATFRQFRRKGIQTALEDPTLWSRIGTITLVGPRALLGHPRVIERASSVCVRHVSDAPGPINLFDIFDGRFPPATIAGGEATQLQLLLKDAWALLRQWGINDMRAARAVDAELDNLMQHYFNDRRFSVTGPSKDKSRPNALAWVLVHEGTSDRAVGSTYRASDLGTLARALREAAVKIREQACPTFKRPSSGKDAIKQWQKFYLKLRFVIDRDGG